MISKEEAKEELRKRKKRAEFKAEALCHPKQRRLVQSIVSGVIRFICALAGRQSGKSFSGVMAALLVAWVTPRVNIIYVSSTYSTCQKMAFLPARDMVQDYCLPATPRYGNAPAIEFANGSVIYFIGADSEKAIGRLRGTPNLVMCIIDESGVYGDEMLASMIKAVSPGLRPRAGKLVIMGTPPKGRTTGTAIDISNNPAYEQHRFDYRDNDRVPSFVDVEKIIDEDLAAQGVDRSSSYFKNEYLAEVSVDDSERVYAFDDSRNYFDKGGGAEVITQNAAIYMRVGVGPNDVIGLLQWEDDDSTIYHTREIVTRSEEMIGTLLRRWYDDYLPAIVVAYAGEHEQSIKTLQHRYFDVPIQAADKSAVTQQIADLNDFLRSGRLRTFRGSQFSIDVKLPVWEKKIVNGKIDEAGTDAHGSIAAMRNGVIAVRPLLPLPRVHVTPAAVAAQKAAEERRRRMQGEQRTFRRRPPAERLDDATAESYGDERYDPGDDEDGSAWG